MNYTKNLKFDEKPNYGYMFDLLNKGLLDISRGDMLLFDWEMVMPVIGKETSA